MVTRFKIWCFDRTILNAVLARTPVVNEFSASLWNRYLPSIVKNFGSYRFVVAILIVFNICSLNFKISSPVGPSSLTLSQKMPLLTSKLNIQLRKKLVTCYVRTLHCMA